MDDSFQNDEALKFQPNLTFYQTVQSDKIPNKTQGKFITNARANRLNQLSMTIDQIKESNFNSQTRNTTKFFQTNTGFRQQQRDLSLQNAESLSSLRKSLKDSSLLLQQNGEKKEIISAYKNYPSYTMGSNSISYKQIISKDHVQDIVGKQTPGVGTYCSQNYLAVSKKAAPSWKLPVASRFQELDKIQEYKAGVPVGYLGPQREFSLKKLSFPRDERFKARNSYDFKNAMPGPGEYETANHNSIEKAIRGDQSTDQIMSHSFTDGSRNYQYQGLGTLANKTLYKFDKSKLKKVYFHEFSKEFQNVEGPGPGKYAFENFISSFNPDLKKGSVFNREQRRMSLPKEKDPIPTQYASRNEQSKLFQQKSFLKATQSFSKANRCFDPVKMNGMHSTLWKKGVNL